MNLEIITNSIQNTLDSFDFSFCISVNVLTYIVIKTIDEIKGVKNLSTWGKRVVLLICLIIISVIYYFAGMDIKHLTNSAILAPVFWTWIMKPLCKVFNIDYKQIND